MYNTVSVRSQDVVVPGVMTLTTLAPRWRPPARQPILHAEELAGAGPVPYAHHQHRPYRCAGGDTDLPVQDWWGGERSCCRTCAAATRWSCWNAGQGLPINGSCRRAAVIGWGIGIAPLRPLVEQLRAQGTEVYAHLSAKSEDDLFHQELFRTLGAGGEDHHRAE